LPFAVRNARLRAVNKARRMLLIGGCVIAAALLVAALEVARYAGMFASVDSVFAGRCDAISLAGGSEDIEIDRERGIAYLSFRDNVNRGESQGEAAGGGSVMLLDLNGTERTPRAALTYDPKNFHPFGISLLRRPDVPPRLFAISHRQDGSGTVEILEQGGIGQYVPAATVSDAAFVHPNAVAAVGPRQFYLANDSIARGSWQRAREFLLRRGSGTLYFYDGTKAQVAAEGLGFPAGIALSPDTSRLYVGEALAKVLRVFARDPVNGELTPEETIPLGAAPDNLDVDTDGVVWIAAHPKLLDFASAMRDATKRAPTQVWRFDPRGTRPAEGERDTRLTRVYSDAGDSISAGSVAAHWGDEFLIGAPLDPKVLICRPAP
jgi:arylesterase / paraoxonase